MFATMRRAPGRTRVRPAGPPPLCLAASLVERSSRALVHGEGARETELSAAASHPPCDGRQTPLMSLQALSPERHSRRVTCAGVCCGMQPKEAGGKVPHLRTRRTLRAQSNDWPLNDYALAEEEQEEDEEEDEEGEEDPSSVISPLVQGSFGSHSHTHIPICRTPRARRRSLGK